MRIIAGKFRSRRIIAPEGYDVRPTSDRLRETLFNVLAPRIEGARFLDLYAGTGAVGIEAISRSASEVVFVESEMRSLRAIRENLKELGIEGAAEVVQEDAPRALRRMQGEFDVVFLDPPYAMQGQYEASLGLLGAGALLAPDAWVIAEHEKRYQLQGCYGKLVRFRTLVQGDAALSFYRQG